MALKPLRIMAVGQIRTPHWKAAAAHYLERLRRWRDIREHVIKDGQAALPVAERNKIEGQRLLAALAPADCCICMDERGTAHTSEQFAVFLERLSENATSVPCFIIGGAYGLDDSVRAAARHVISLGPMTLPHELARVVLLEQIYRAEAIVRRVPYHH